jgi:serine/threonine-protein kinase RsbW
MEKTIYVPSKIENLRKIEKFIDEISLECKFTSEIYGNVLIATLEAANNAIVHGNKLNENIDVVVKASCDKNTLSICIEDKGPGFDYKNIPDPTSPENIENVSGRGIFLMEKLSDDLVFEKNGSVVKLIFNLLS